jgi:hypothetical protein
MNESGPKMWARIRLLQACERLQIPVDLWPHVPSLQIPHEYNSVFETEETFTLPGFSTHYETEAEWRQKSRDEFEIFLDRIALLYRRWLKESVDRDILVPIPRTRDTTPLNVRYEWAALHLCYRRTYKELAATSNPAVSESTVKKAVYRILVQAELKGT